MEELSTQQILDLLTESSELGAQNLHIFGGEPFLKDDLEEICRYAHDLDFTLSIATNGTRIAPHLKWLEKFNPFIGITLHGPKEFHDTFCGRRGSYQTGFSGLQQGLEMQLNIGVVTCVTKLNMQSYFPWLESLVDLGVRTFFVIYFSPLGRGKNRLDMQLPNHDWISLYIKLSQYVSQLNSSIQVYFERSIVPNSLLLYQKIYNPSKPLLSCALPLKSNCAIDANSDVYPCILFLRNPKFRIGNFNINSLHEIWNRLTSAFIDNKFQGSTKCKPCQYHTLCQAGCPAYHQDGHDFRCDGTNIPLCPLYTELL
jgi:radical SAM protein with 4Fe4S-binding SPASM domain